MRDTERAYFDKIAEINSYSPVHWIFSEYNGYRDKPFFMQLVLDFGVNIGSANPPKMVLDIFNHLPIWFYLNFTGNDGFVESHKRLADFAGKGEPVKGISGPHSAIVITTSRAAQCALVTGFDTSGKIIRDYDITRIHDLQNTDGRMVTPTDLSELLGLYYEREFLSSIKH